MKYYFALSVIFFWSNSFGQIEQIQTNCTGGIGYIQESDTAKYFGVTDQGILRYSKVNGNVTLLPPPQYPNGDLSGIQIIGDSIFYASTIFGGYPYPFKLSVSRNQGQSWQIFLDTVCDKDVAQIIVMDTSKIFLLGTAQPSLKTFDAGHSWMETSEVGSYRDLVRYNDSTRFMAAGNGVLFTKDNGDTWNYFDDGFVGANCMSRSVFPKAEDSIYLFSHDNGCCTFAYCFSSDYSEINWNILNHNTVSASDIYVVSKDEIYLAGYNGNNKHRIAKSVDLGNTWQVFDPGYDGAIYSITPLNDTVFLVSGDYGIMYKWNKNQTQWSSLGLEEQTQQTVRISPNPSGGVFHLESEMVFEISGVTGFTGRSVSYAFEAINGNLTIEEPAGIYFVQLKQADGTSVCKIVLE